jgi:hypothetical protein
MKLFVAATTLSVGLLLKAGVPVVPIAFGVLLAAFLSGKIRLSPR